MTDDHDPQAGGERIAKAIARAGLCPRREAEEGIAAGRVAINGEIITSPARDVTARDRIAVDGEPLPQRERTRLFLYHKPRGLVTSTADPEGRPTIFASLPRDLPRLISVGRLDINSEGLLLLTNDGGLARVLELPETGWLRRYRVRAHGSVTADQLAALRKGITVEGVRYGPIEATLDRPQGSNVWITFAMREGKNREVRNVLGALGLQVNRLIRVSYGPFQLGELPEGEIAEIFTRHLREQLGERIAAQAGAEFSGPIVQRAPPARNDARPPQRERDRRAHDDRPRMRPDKPRSDARTNEKPRKRRGSQQHVWRDEGKPVRLKFHGARADRREARERAEQGETGVVSDRKGRKVTLVRFGGKPDAARDFKHRRHDRGGGAKPRGGAKPGRARNRRGVDRRSGPRPSRPRKP